MKLPGYFTSPQAADYLEVSRQRVHQIIGERGWTVYKTGRTTLIPDDLVNQYRDDVLRTKLVKELGQSKGFGEGLYVDSDIDCPCPECGGFAVEWPPLLPETILCVAGHRVKLTETGEIK